LKGIAEEVKNYDGMADEDSKPKRRGRDVSPEVIKEAFVVWGSLEVPKLFANSHLSTKLLKNCHMVLKQAICLARS
jgi:hypothetical protein